MIFLGKNNLDSAKMEEIQYEINNRPGKNLNFLSSKQLFYQTLKNKLHSDVESTITTHYFFLPCNSKI